MKISLPVVAAGLLAVASLAAAAFAAPTFDKDGKLVIPDGRERWPAVGTTFALSYEGEGATNSFNTVRLDPESYDAYVKTGKFPAGAMLYLEVRRPVTEEAPAKGGQTQGALVGRSLHVKDEKGGAGTWTFYRFSADQKTGEPIARSQACYACHEQHAKDDTVFTQFYPSLVEARDRTVKAAGGQ